MDTVTFFAVRSVEKHLRKTQKPILLENGRTG